MPQLLPVPVDAVPDIFQTTKPLTVTVEKAVALTPMQTDIKIGFVEELI